MKIIYNRAKAQWFVAMAVDGYKKLDFVPRGLAIIYIESGWPVEYEE